MKAKHFFMSLGLAALMVCLPSCKNNASSNNASADDKNAEDAKANVEASANEQADSAPLLSVADLIEIYDNFEDNHYFENHFSNKGMKQLHINDYKNEDGVPDDHWFTEVWGVNMKFDESKDMYEKSFTGEGDDALALVVNHTDDPDACIYFFNPKYQDIYLKQLEEQGYKHLEGDDEFGSHYDLYAKDGYKPGDIDKVFTLTQEEGIFVLRHAYI